MIQKLSYSEKKNLLIADFFDNKVDFKLFLQKVQ